MLVAPLPSFPASLRTRRLMAGTGQLAFRTEHLAEGVRPSHLPRDIVTIYGLCDPATGELRYVGKTRYEPERRLTYHMTRCHRERVASANWMRTLKARGCRPIVVDLERVSLKADWGARERFWIAHCREAGFRLLNHTDGGEGAHGAIFSAAHKAKISAALKTGRMFSCEKCGAQFWRKQHAIKNGETRFCSRACYQASLRGVHKPTSPSFYKAGVAAAAAKRAAMSDCKRGHPLNGENVFKTSNGARGCKECRRLHKLTYRAKINAKVA